MIKTEQLLALVNAHIDHDDERFREILIQISASEVNHGNKNTALKIESVLKKIEHSENNKNTFQMKMLNKDVSDLFLQKDKHYKLDDLVVTNEIKNNIQEIIGEYKAKELLKSYNLENSRKIMLYGPPGTGKTMTAEIIANELDLPFFIIQLERVISRYMGESGKNLSKIFEEISKIPAVYLFDEFDSIACQRGMEHDVGEQRRILNAFLQLLEREHSESIIIAATNDEKSIDEAMFRRFDEKIKFRLPEFKQIETMISKSLQIIPGLKFNSGEIKQLLSVIPIKGKSQADIKQICNKALKDSVMITSGYPATSDNYGNYSEFSDIIYRKMYIYRKMNNECS